MKEDIEKMKSKITEDNFNNLVKMHNKFKDRTLNYSNFKHFNSSIFHQRIKIAN